MTLVHFPRMTIQPFDATGAPKGDPIIVQGDTNKGGTITAEISGLSSNALKVAASDIEYWILDYSPRYLGHEIASGRSESNVWSVANTD